jgi:hypothetical protein
MECPICSEQYDSGDHESVQINNFEGCCHHCFGKSCILEWCNTTITRVKTCPLCRIPLFRLGPHQPLVSHIRDGPSRQLRPRGHLSIRESDMRMWAELTGAVPAPPGRYRESALARFRNHPSPTPIWWTTPPEITAYTSIIPASIAQRSSATPRSSASPSSGS